MQKIRKIFLIIYLFSCAVFADQTAIKPKIVHQPAKTTTSKTVKNRTTGVRNSAKTISFADNEQISVVLSKVDINRIAIQNDKILSLNGPTGLYTAKNDSDGAAYITLYSDTPFTLYVTTVGGHSLSLFIVPTATVGKTIVFIPTSLPKIADTQEDVSSYQQNLITLMNAMLNKNSLEDYAYREVKKAKSQDFLGLATLTPIANYSGAIQDGIIYKVENKTSRSITFNPANFYQTGVKAIALSQQMLAPHDTGLLYEIVSKE